MERQLHGFCCSNLFGRGLIMTAEALFWLIPLAAGLVLGGLYFAGLRWTIARAIRSRRPAFFLFASWLTRMGLLISCLVLVSDDRWERLIACVAGFVIARFIARRWWHATPYAHAQAEADGR